MIMYILQRFAWKPSSNPCSYVKSVMSRDLRKWIRVTFKNVNTRIQSLNQHGVIYCTLYLAYRPGTRVDRLDDVDLIFRIHSHPHYQYGIPKVQNNFFAKYTRHLSKTLPIHGRQIILTGLPAGRQLTKPKQLHQRHPPAPSVVSVPTPTLHLLHYINIFYIFKSLLVNWSLAFCT